ncbi:DNA mismatch repair protein MutS [Novosphingobium fuchskuhlense]|uniref:DNA mismatch repair protein MutS n=1 Tax=Novosphingobium fuchskuhlense TaxID=1117702 RepID=A0A117UXB2_9SPHN|nr:Smr/MutS family protein [Novosphingobium fuchskuhlense]KUR72563.1 DNA mismatch repair protein MutS [Novosphingobium fuchskuhlense]
MRAPPRGLSPEEAALWRRVAATVTPIHPKRPVPAIASTAAQNEPPPLPPKRVKGRVPPPRSEPVAAATPVRPLTAGGLDSSWERKLTRGPLQPDVTIDLHGLSIALAHSRLNGGIEQALAMGARVILLIAGKHRPVAENGLPNHLEPGDKRGAIRARLLDWLAASPQAGRIASVRPAQPRHGGDGAVYIVLRKAR